LSAKGRLCRIVAIAACAAIVTSCASMRGGVEGDLGRAAAQVASAAISSQLSLEAYADGRTTVAAADTALADMLEEVDQAAAAASDRAAETEEQAGLRSEVTGLADSVSDNIVRGRDIIAGLGPQAEAEQVASRLGDDGARLQSLSEQVGTG
jgi:ABC-type transporter Mla subunit MlaD